MKKLLLLAAVAVTILAVPPKTIAQIPVWTTACSAGATIQKIDLASYSVVNNYLTFAAGKTGDVVARYNVTNVTGVPMPLWTTLQLGYYDIDVNTKVTATLYQLDPCENVVMPICGPVTSNDDGDNCVTCQFPAGAIDFNTKVYWVDVIINRTATGQVVRAESLRIY